MTIVVGVPVYYNIPECKNSVEKLVDYSKKNMPEHEIEVCYAASDNKKWDLHDIIYKRNFIIRFAIEHNADYILYIDDDVIVPPDGLAMMLPYAQRKGLGICAGYARVRASDIWGAGVQFAKDSQGRVHEEPLQGNPKVIHRYVFRDPDKEPDAVAMYFTLVEKSVFRSLKFSYSENISTDAEGNKFQDGEDIEYCLKALRLSAKIGECREVRCEHLAFNEEHK